MTLRSSVKSELRLKESGISGGSIESQKSDIIIVGNVSCGGIRLNTQINGTLIVDGNDIADDARSATLSRLGISSSVPKRERKKKKEKS